MKLIYKIYYFILAILIVGFFIGMYSVLEQKDVDINSIKTVIENNIDTSKLNEDDGVQLKKLYGISKHDIEDFIYYSPQSNMEANEILIIKTADNGNKEIIAKINDRIQKQSDSFENYEETQYEILKGHVLEEQGDYIILIVDENSKIIKEQINSLFS